MSQRLDANAQGRLEVKRVDYASQQRNPGKHPIGLITVAVGHVILGYALVNGLGSKIVEVIKAPIETKLIEEVKPPPPPPPPENLPPPPKMALPPPSFMPPPEIQVTNPSPAPTITVTREAPPAAPVSISPAPAPTPAPAPAPGPTAPPAPPAPKRQAVPATINVASCEKPEFPAAALRAEATGTTKIRFTVDANGRVSKAEVEKSSGPSREHRLLDRTAIEALSKCPFKPGTDENGQAVGATTVVDYVWKTE